MQRAIQEKTRRRSEQKNVAELKNDLPPLREELSRSNDHSPQRSALSQACSPFAKGLNFYKLFWVFFIGSFLGVVIETIWCFATTLRLENRQGLIYGPFNALYGFGALAMTLGLYWLSGKRDIWVFGGGFVIGSVYEYFCSYFQESLFGTVSWQYDQFPLNVNGRINFLYSMFWGLLALLWVKELFPRLSRLIERIPARIGRPLTWVLLVFMSINIVISSLAVARYNERHEGIPPANQAEQFLDTHYPDERMREVYPNMVFIDHEEE